MNIFERMAEIKITDAIMRGEFENLSGRGNPLDLSVDEMVPETLRMAYKILKNAGYVPPELDLRKEISNLGNSLHDSNDTEARKIRKRLQLLFIRLDTVGVSRTSLLVQDEYYQKVINRLSGKEI